MKPLDADDGLQGSAGGGTHQRIREGLELVAKARDNALRRLLDQGSMFSEDTHGRTLAHDELIIAAEDYANRILTAVAESRAATHDLRTYD